MSSPFQSPSLELRAIPDAWWSGISFLIRDKEIGDGKVAIAKPIVLEVKDPVLDAFVEREPTFKLSAAKAQMLMDDLWNCGIRPSEGTGSAGSFSAQARHLEDLRALVARSYGVELKGSQ